MRFFPTIAGLVLLITLASCDAITGKEIARLAVDAVSTPENSVEKETSLDLQKGEVIALWSHLDLEYDEPLELRFQVQLLRDTVVDIELEVDPFEKNITMGEARTSFNGHVDWSFTGKNGEVTIGSTGRYTVRTRLVASENRSLVLRKAELILKK